MRKTRSVAADPDRTRCAHPGCAQTEGLEHLIGGSWCPAHDPHRPHGSFADVRDAERIRVLSDAILNAPEPTDEVRAQWAKQHQEWLRKNEEAVRATYPTRTKRNRRTGT